MVTDKRVEVGDNADGVVHISTAHICVGGDADDALFTQRSHCVPEDANGLEQGFPNDRFHDVQLQLTCFGGHGHRQVVAEHLQADLVDHFGDHRVHFGRHDG